MPAEEAFSTIIYRGHRNIFFLEHSLISKSSETATSLIMSKDDRVLNVMYCRNHAIQVEVTHAPITRRNCKLSDLFMCGTFIFIGNESLLSF
jgi:hypothetical protein